MIEKHFLSYEEQIDFLKEKKKLDIADVDFAKKTLFKTGYFSLINGYKGWKASASGQCGGVLLAHRRKESSKAGG